MTDRVSRALVTGCAGFIGSHLTESLLADGHERPRRRLLQRQLRPAAESSEPRAGPGLGRVRVRAGRPVARRPGGARGRVRRRLPPRRGAGRAPELGRGSSVRAQQRARDATPARGDPAAPGAALRLRVVLVGLRPGRAAAHTGGHGAGAVLALRHDEAQRRAPVRASITRNFGVDAVALRYFSVYGPRQRPDMAFRIFCEPCSPASRSRCSATDARPATSPTSADVVAATRPPRPPGARAGSSTSAAARASASTMPSTSSERFAGRQLDVQRTEGQHGDVRDTGADITARAQATRVRPTTSFEQGFARNGSGPELGAHVSARR